MNLNTRLTKIETINSVTNTQHQGEPVRPIGMTDQEYLEAVKAKRIELGLKPSEPIPIMAICYNDVGASRTNERL